MGEGGNFAGPSEKKREFEMTDLEITTVAEKIIASLSSAFGGRSQWRSTEAGASVWGQHNNNGLLEPEAVLRKISALEACFWQDTPAQASEFLRVALQVFEASRASNAAWAKAQGYRLS